MLLNDNVMTDPGLASSLTRRLRAAVPLAQALGFSVDEVTPERSVFSLAAAPLAVNQNETFQASTFYILADYAVGLACFASFPEYSLFGLSDAQPGGVVLQGWLKDGYVKHVKPAKGGLRAVVSIPESERERMIRELKTAGKTTCQGEAQIFQAGTDTLVALAKHTVVFIAQT